jgi:hypothetical protein
VAVLTSPVIAVGMAAVHSTPVIKILAPYLSLMGPRMKRMKMVPPTPTIDDVQICAGFKFSEVRISLKRGVMANQMKNALKNENQEQ